MDFLSDEIAQKENRRGEEEDGKLLEMLINNPLLQVARDCASKFN